MRRASIFFFNDTATTEIYTLSLHDALPISLRDGARGDGHRRPRDGRRAHGQGEPGAPRRRPRPAHAAGGGRRSEEHTSELQSRQYLVCRLLLEKKNYELMHPPLDARSAIRT